MTERNERRQVRSDDPSFSPETNERLTDELRDIVGASEVEVPADRPHHERDRHATGSAARASVANLWLLIGVLAIAAGIAVLISAANSGGWWVAAIAIVLDVLGLAVVLDRVRGMVRERESVTPELAAEMEAEGDPDPEATVTELAEEYRPRRNGTN